MIDIVFSFPYKKEKLSNGKEVFRPTIPVEIGYKGQIMNFVAIVDSGSDVSFLTQWVADALGIEIKGKPSEVGTINGNVNVIEELVNVSIRHKNESEHFILPVDIPVDKIHSDEIILGRKGFFDRFDITFKENSKRIILAKSKRG